MLKSYSQRDNWHGFIVLPAAAQVALRARMRSALYVSKQRAELNRRLTSGRGSRRVALQRDDMPDDRDVLRHVGAPNDDHSDGIIGFFAGKQGSFELGVVKALGLEWAEAIRAISRHVFEYRAAAVGAAIQESAVEGA